MEITNIPIKEIFSDGDFNCRGPIVPFDVIELMNSIKANGLQQPIVVQPYGAEHSKYKYRIVMGHRRHKACELASMETIPCIIRLNLDRTQALTMNLIENLERKNLTLMQEARSIAKFVTINLPMQEIGKLIGKPYGWIQIRVMALKLPVEVQAEIDAGFVKTEDIRDLYFMPDKSKMFDIVKEIKDRKLRGEKGRLKFREKKTRVLDPFHRGPQTIQSIVKMMEVMRESIGNGLHTRALAWSAGEIATLELYDDIEAMAKEQGKTFVRPSNNGTSSPTSPLKCESATACV